MRLQNKFADGIRGLCVYGDKVLRDDASAALYFEVGTAADADPINVKITNDTDWELLEDMIHDSIIDMRSYLNYEDEESLPEGVIPAVKELTLIRFNKDGVEGIASESQSFGGSTTYMDALPDQVKRTIRRYRRLPR